MDIYLSIYGCVTYYRQSIDRSILFIFVAKCERIFEHRRVKTAAAATEAAALTEALTLTKAERQWLLEEAPPVEDSGHYLEACAASLPIQDPSLPLPPQQLYSNVVIECPLGMRE